MSDDTGGPVRQPISKKTRFEVFKRDRFTCQYCGKKAPEITLQCDHIIPVAEGGRSDFFNLVSACRDCNGGKGARRLEDTTVIERQRAEIEAQADRLEQLEMLLKWREAMAGAEDTMVDHVADYIATKSQYGVAPSGRKFIKRWLKAYPHDELMAAIDASFDHYCVVCQDGKTTNESWNVAFDKVPAVLRGRRADALNPGLRQINYIRGILRNRMGWYAHRDGLALLLAFQEANGSLDWAQQHAKAAGSWEAFHAPLAAYLIEHGYAESDA